MAHLERAQIARAYRVIAVSELVAGLLNSRHPRAADRIITAPNGVDNRRFSPGTPSQRLDARQKFGVTDAVVFLGVAHNFQLKGMDRLLGAFVVLARQTPGARLLIAGGEPDASWRDMTAQLGLEQHVRFLGQVQDMTELYHASDILVHPTRWDACALVTLEAMACGLAVITTATNGASAAIEDGRSGIILKQPDDLIELAEHMMALLDPARRQTLGEAAREAIKGRSLEANYAAVARELLASSDGEGTYGSGLPFIGMTSVTDLTGRMWTRTVSLSAWILSIFMIGLVGWVQFAGGTDGLWRDPLHDRNTHLLNGLTIALALRDGDLTGAVAGALADPVWPPLHALFLAAILLIGGWNLDLAVGPSLAGWCLMVLATIAIVRRLAPKEHHVAASFLALALAVSSPGLRLLASDVMLEGLGAGISALALLSYLVLNPRTPSFSDRYHAWRWRGFALTLTLLFLTKFNYWLLVVVAAGLTALVHGWEGFRLRPIRVMQCQAVATQGLSHPLTVIALITGIGAVILVHPDGLPLDLAGRPLRVFPARYSWRPGR